MINFVLLISRHGKTRLNKYYKHFTQQERQNIQKEVSWSPPLIPVYRSARWSSGAPRS